MRLIRMATIWSVFLAAVLCLFPSNVEAQEGHVVLHGTVTDTLTKNPLAGVRISVRDAALGPIGALQQLHTTWSDSDGKFVIEGLSAGAYDVIPAKNGYVLPGQGAVGSDKLFVTINSTRAAENLSIAMSRAATISGRIIYPSGAPAVGARVIATMPVYDQWGQRTTAMVAGTAPADVDDRGLFRIFGLPAGYYVLNLVSPRKDPSVALLYSLYYPGTDDLSRAQDISVESGEEKEIAAWIAPFPETVPLEVDIVSDVEIVSGAYRTLRFGPKGMDLPTVTSTNLAFGGPDRIVLSGVPLGLNEIQVSWDTPEGKAFGETTIDTRLLSSSQKRASVLVHSHATARIQVILRDDNGAEHPLSNVGVSLGPVSRVFGAMSGRSGADGVVLFSNAPETSYRISVSGVPEGVFWERGAVNGEEIESAIATVQGATEISLVFALGSGDVKGRVTNKEKEPFRDALVALVPREKELRRHFQLFRSARTDQNGEFILTNVPPGEFKAFAWANLYGSGPFLAPDFLSAYEDAGTLANFPGEEPRISLEILSKGSE